MKKKVMVWFDKNIDLIITSQLNFLFENMILIYNINQLLSYSIFSIILFGPPEAKA